MLPVVQFYDLDEMILYVPPPDRTFFVGETKTSLGLDSQGLVRHYRLELSVRVLLKNCIASFTTHVGTYSTLTSVEDKKVMIERANEWSWKLIKFLNREMTPIVVHRGTIDLVGARTLLAVLDLDLLGIDVPVENNDRIG
jgi:hypothetical protein